MSELYLSINVMAINCSTEKVSS